MIARREIQDYLSGEKLYGDDFSQDEIVEWFKNEEEAYANLLSKGREPYRYAYHALNYVHGYRHLPPRHFKHVLSIGGAYGDELEPIATRTDRITIVDPSQAFAVKDVRGTPVNYVRPSASGVLPVATASCDLVTCLGTLHHIANVSFVLSELARCLSSGGYALVREPTHSMGDWRFPRDHKGLTAKERGIPRALFENMIRATGLEIVKHTKCMFCLTGLLHRITKLQLYNSGLVVRIDALLSRAFAFNEHYHALTTWQRVRPTGAFFVLRKPISKSQG